MSEMSTPPSRVRYVTAAVALIAAGIVVSASVTNSPDISGRTDDGTPDDLDAQTRSSSVYDGIGSSGEVADVTTVANTLAELGGDSFAGLEIQPNARRILSYWVGSVPNEAEQYVQSQPGDVTIEILVARFSRAELTAAAQRVADSQVGRGAGVSWIAAKSNGSGIEIGLTGAEPSEAVKAEIAKLARLPNDAIRYLPNREVVPADSPTVSEG